MTSGGAIHRGYTHSHHPHHGHGGRHLSSGSMTTRPVAPLSTDQRTAFEEAVASSSLASTSSGLQALLRDHPELVSSELAKAAGQGWSALNESARGSRGGSRGGTGPPTPGADGGSSCGCSEDGTAAMDAAMAAAAAQNAVLAMGGQAGSAAAGAGGAGASVEGGAAASGGGTSSGPSSKIQYPEIGEGGHGHVAAQNLGAAGECEQQARIPSRCRSCSGFSCCSRVQSWPSSVHSEHIGIWLRCPPYALQSIVFLLASPLLVRAPFFLGLFLPFVAITMIPSPPHSILHTISHHHSTLSCHFQPFDLVSSRSISVGISPAARLISPAPPGGLFGLVVAVGREAGRGVHDLTRGLPPCAACQPASQPVASLQFSSFRN